MRCRVRLFQDWLRDRGPQLISLQYTDREEQQEKERLDQASYVSSDELSQLARERRPYRGRSISEDELRGWLEQFDHNRVCRLMYQMLKGVRFYDQNRMADMFREAMHEIRRHTVERKHSAQRSRRDLLVTSWEGCGGGGMKYGRIFAHAARILASNVVSWLKIEDSLRQNKLQYAAEELQAVVVVDDFAYGIGVDAELALLSRQLPNSAKLFYVALCGLAEEWATFRDRVQTFGRPVRVILCDPLGADARAFSPEAKLFASPEDVERTRSWPWSGASHCSRTGLLGTGMGSYSWPSMIPAQQRPCHCCGKAPRTGGRSFTRLPKR